MPEVIRCVLLCMLEAVEGELCLLEELDVMRCMLLCMPEVPEVMRCVLRCTLEAREGGLYSLEVLEVLGVLEYSRRCAVLCPVCWRPWRVSSVCYVGRRPRDA